MSRVSSYDPREYQVYTVQQRPWQSNPDLRMQKWNPKSAIAANLGLHSSSVDDSLDVIEIMKKKKQILAQLLQDPANESSYRYIVYMHNKAGLILLRIRARLLILSFHVFVTNSHAIV